MPRTPLSIGTSRLPALSSAICPIERLKRYLLGCGVSADQLEAIGEQVGVEVRAAVERARAAPRPDPSGVLEHVYSAPQLAGIQG